MSNTRHIHKQISAADLSNRVGLLLDEMLPAEARESMTLTSRDRRQLIKKLAAVREELAASWSSPKATKSPRTAWTPINHAIPDTFRNPALPEPDGHTKHEH